jgi:hypothetical protein
MGRNEVTDKRVIALGAIEKDKIMVARAYNKKVKAKSFQVGDLVWKIILPLRNKDRKFEKWSPSCEGPYKVKQVMSGNTYLLQTLQGNDIPKTLNGCFLKQYHHSMWQDA